MPELSDLTLYVAVFVFVIALIGVLAWVLRSLFGGSGSSVSGLLRRSDRRLGVVEAASVDGRRKLVLIRRDSTEHLILTGGPIDLVIETGIRRPVEHAAERPVEVRRDERGGITFARDEQRQNKEAYGDD